jgi:hypothetical protein
MEEYSAGRGYLLSMSRGVDGVEGMVVKIYNLYFFKPQMNADIPVKIILYVSTSKSMVF